MVHFTSFIYEDIHVHMSHFTTLFVFDDIHVIINTSGYIKMFIYFISNTNQDNLLITKPNPSVLNTIHGAFYHVVHHNNVHLAQKCSFTSSPTLANLPTV